MTQLLSNRIFARFWLAGLLFVLATWSLHIAMLVYVYELTGSPFATSLIPVFASIPGIVVGPIAGVLVDRWDRKRVMAGGALALVGLLV
ncbi:MAG: MFS transporter, partial [Chloroflexia bacterium]|nr:MFS transporter [Chloroflexia bacterium]